MWCICPMVVDAGRIIGRDHRQRAGDSTRVSVILVAKVTNIGADKYGTHAMANVALWATTP